MPIKIDVVSDKPAIARVSVAGSLDANTAPQLEKALEGIDSSVLLIVLDMQDLDYISSAGLRVVFAARKRQDARGGELVFTNMGANVKKVFEIVKALPTLSVFASEAEMDDYLAAFQKRKS